MVRLGGIRAILVSLILFHRKSYFDNPLMNNHTVFGHATVLTKTKPTSNTILGKIFG